MKHRMVALALCAMAVGGAATALAEPVTIEETIAHAYRAEDRFVIDCAFGSRYVCATLEGDADNMQGSFELQAIGKKPNGLGTDYEEFPSTGTGTVCLQRPGNPGSLRAEVRVTAWTNPSGEKLDYALTAQCFRFGVFPSIIETRTHMSVRHDD